LRWGSGKPSPLEKGEKKRILLRAAIEKGERSLSRWGGGGMIAFFSGGGAAEKSETAPPSPEQNVSSYWKR